ncbi:MAG: MarR family transcriptional regulator [Paracoccaceae bacterium]
MNQARPAPVSASKARLRLWLRLLKATRTIEAELRERLRRDHASTLPRFDVMAALSRRPEGLRMSALSGVLRVSNGNVTGIVERLVAEGLVERRAVEGDRRAMLVRLTPVGAAQFAEMAATHEGWIDTLLSGLTAEEAEALSRRLEDVAQSGAKETE